METNNTEAATQVARTEAIDSSRIDNALLIRTLEHQREQIRDAMWQLRRGLRIRNNPAMAELHLDQALRILGNLGAS